MTTPIAPSTPKPDRAIPPAMFSALRIASSGLSAQSFKMEIIAQNLANAETTRTPEGGPYQRRTVTLEAIAGAIDPTSKGATTSAVTTPGSTTATAIAAALSTDPTSTSSTDGDAGHEDSFGGVRVAGVGIDTTEGPLVYDPGHPDANAQGYVRMPNVNMTGELMDLMTARRLFQANATVFEVAKSMLSQATQI